MLIVARIALALMLFAQGAMAWASCELPERSPALALSSASGHECCEEEIGPKAPVSPICFAHCLADKQALYKVVLDVPQMSAFAGMRVPAVPDAGSQFASFEDAVGLLLATGPPRRILLQSFQI